MAAENTNTTTNDTNVFNESIYFIEPQTDPELTNCHGFELKSELKVPKSDITYTREKARFTRLPLDRANFLKLSIIRLSD